MYMLLANKFPPPFCYRLISNGASVERMTLDGQSVLDIAVTNDKIQIIEFLLSKDTLSAFTIESALNVLVK